MGKGRFVNQKLGKNVSRKARMLKAELNVPGGRKLSGRFNKPSSAGQKPAAGQKSANR